MVRKTAISTLGAFKEKSALPILEKIVTTDTESDELRKAASLANEVINGITPDYS